MEIEYSAGGNVASYGGYKFRKDPKSGYYLCTKKTDAGRRERLHVYVWRKTHGDIPAGCHIHHIDENKDNNEPDNLECIEGPAHSSLHGKERAHANYEELVRSLKAHALPAAAVWHGSAEGKEWHSKHAKETAARIQAREYVCQQCGKVFYAKPFGLHKYCSNACKTKSRLESGVDDEIRTCAICGAQFRTNKYTKKRCCSKRCANLLLSDTKRKRDAARACL